MAVPQVPRISGEEAAALKAAMARYADRPLVKEFIADLRQDPVVGDSFAEGRQPDPADLMKVMGNPASVQRITMKYAGRPEFMALLLELMNDPAFKPLMGNMNGMVPSPPPGGRPGGPAPAPPSGPGGEPRLDESAISGPAPARKVAPKTVPAP
jgi:hypothetical protein